MATSPPRGLQDTCSGSAPQQGHYQGRRDQVHVEILLIPFFCKIWRKFDSDFRSQSQHEETQGLCEPHLLPFEQELKGSIMGVPRETGGTWDGLKGSRRALGCS